MFDRLAPPTIGGGHIVQNQKTIGHSVSSSLWLSIYWENEKTVNPNYPTDPVKYPESYQFTVYVKGTIRYLSGPISAMFQPTGETQPKPITLYCNCAKDWTKVFFINKYETINEDITFHKEIASDTDPLFLQQFHRYEILKGTVTTNFTNFCEVEYSSTHEAHIEPSSFNDLTASFDPLSPTISTGMLLPNPISDLQLINPFDSDPTTGIKKAPSGQALTVDCHDAS